MLFSSLKIEIFIPHEKGKLFPFFFPFFLCERDTLEHCEYIEEKKTNNFIKCIKLHKQNDIAQCTKR